MDFHIAEVVASDPDLRPSIVWQAITDLERAEDLARHGHDDLVIDDPELDLVRFHDTREFEHVRLLAIAGSEPGGVERGPYGFRALAASGDVGLGPADVVGRAAAELQRRGNDHMIAGESIIVTPRTRGQGIGRALSQAVDHVARTAGRTTILAWASVDPTGPDARSIADPTGKIHISPDEPGVSFAVAHGYQLAQAERHSVQPLPVPDAVLTPALDQRRAREAGYELVQYEGPTPEPYLESVARLYEAMATDPPLGDVDWRPETWDSEGVRNLDEIIGRGRRVFTSAVRHTATGDLVGFTQLKGPILKPEVAYQENTVVLKGHRGHGLGMLIKAANCAFISTERPSTRRVHTWNADENDYMLAINTALGYRQASIEACWQKVLPVAD